MSGAEVIGLAMRNAVTTAELNALRLRVQQLERENARLRQVLSGQEVSE